MRVRNGDAEAPLKVVGDADRKGTMVTLLPSPATFKITEFDFDKLEHRFRELAFLNSGVRLFLTDARHERSEEHTSELQSLMRISYAVFCLKKKTPKTIKQQTIQ